MKPFKKFLNCHCSFSKWLWKAFANEFLWCSIFINIHNGFSQSSLHTCILHTCIQNFFAREENCCQIAHFRFLQVESVESENIFQVKRVKNDNSHSFLLCFWGMYGKILFKLGSQKKKKKTTRNKSPPF